MRHFQRGGALVEFAMVVPVAMFLLLGILQMSYLLYAYHATDNAARLGARWLALHGANCFDGGTDTQGNVLCPASNAAVTDYVQSQMPGLDSQSLTVTPAWNNPPTTWSYAPTTCGTSAVGGCIAQVTVSYDFKFLGGVLGLPGQNGISITSQSQFVAQGP